MITTLVMSTVCAVDLQGRFHGTLPPPAFRGEDVVLSFEQVQGRTLAKVSSLAFDLVNLPVVQSTETDDAIELSLLLPGKPLDVTVRRQGASLSMDMLDGGVRTVLQPVLELGPHTQWGGELPMASGDLEPLIIRIEDGGDSARLDLPMRKIWDHPVDVTRDDDGTTQFSCGGPGGGAFLLTPVGDTAAGMVARGDVMLPLTLTRDLVTLPDRPQHPTGVEPWTAADVEMPLRIETLVSGTHVTPGSGASRTLVLLLGDRGQDRDGSADGHKPLLVLADALARADVESIRLDPPSQGSSDPWPADQGPLTWSVWSLQVSGLVERLRESGRWSDILLCGLDGGAMTALMAAARLRDQVDGVILLSPPAFPKAVVEAEQLRAVLLRHGVDATGAAAIIDAQLAMVRAAAERVNEEALRQAARHLRTLMAEHAGAQPPNDATVDITLAPLRQPGAVRELVEEPRRFLPRITAPVLAMWGSNDTVLDGDLHRQATIAAVESLGGSIEAVMIDKGTHLLGPVPQDNSGRRGVRRTVMPEVLEHITRWVTPAQGTQP